MERRAWRGQQKKELPIGGGFCDEELGGMGRLASGNQGGDQPAPSPVIYHKKPKSEKKGGGCF